MTIEEIIALAETLGGALDDGERAALPQLCRAALTNLQQQLRPGATGYEDVLGCAAAWMALGDLEHARPSGFTAGDISVQRRQEDLTRRAMKMMAPFLADSFAFREV